MKHNKWKSWMILLAAVLMVAGFGKTAQAATLRYDADCIHDGTVGLAYEASIRMFVNGEKPQNAYVQSGSLPSGLSLSVDTSSYEKKVILKGTPTAAGTYTFTVKVEGNNLSFTTKQFKVTIDPAGKTHTLSLSNCTAKNKNGTVTNTFQAGEEVVLTANNLLGSQYVDYWNTNSGGKVNIYAPTFDGTKYYGPGINRFYMPSMDGLTISPTIKSKTLGTFTINAAAEKTDGGDVLESACGTLPVRSLLFALENTNKVNSTVKEAVEQSDWHYGTLHYMYIDLDKDGTDDLKAMYFYNESYSDAGYGQYIQALDGRSVYGEFTLQIPGDTVYAKSPYGVYERFVFKMGSNPHTHSPKSVAAKDATCTADGVKAHYECSCGQWFWDAAGTKVISNHADVTVKALGHDMKVVANKAATCTEDGNMWHCECSRCGNWYWDTAGKNLIPAANHDYVTVKATGHKWGEWTVQKPATVDEEGIEVRVCQNDASHKETRSIAKLPAPETTEAPTEPPTTEAPTTEAPTEPPTTEEPTTQAPETQAPETQAPETQAPETQAPETKAPETQASETQAPETQAPATQAPETKAPETQAPATQAQTEAPQPEKNGSNNTGLYIAIAGLAAACGVLGGILIGKKKQQ